MNVITTPFSSNAAPVTKSGWNGADLQGQAQAEADVTCLDWHQPTIQQQVQEGIQVATKDYEAAFGAGVPKGMAFPAPRTWEL